MNSIKEGKQSTVETFLKGSLTELFDQKKIEGGVNFRVNFTSDENYSVELRFAGNINENTRAEITKTISNRLKQQMSGLGVCDQVVAENAYHPELD